MAEESRGGDAPEQGERFGLSALFDNAIGRLVPPDLLAAIIQDKKLVIKLVSEKIELSLKYTDKPNATGITNLLESVIKDWIENRQERPYYDEYRRVMKSQKNSAHALNELKTRADPRGHRLWGLWLLIKERKITIGSKVMLANVPENHQTWVVQSITSDCQLVFKGLGGKATPLNYKLTE